ncbi:MAG TPA: hypothetical protein VK607_20925 [Kofleriaceae bacterium]|nr:hypothetical protein [Kofleriaceae bacterium]
MENDDSNNQSAESEPKSADRRTFMRAAVKTVVAGTAVAGIAAASGTASAAPAVCGGNVQVPKAVVKARVLCNAQKPIRRDDLIALINGIFDTSVCPACGLGGFPGPWDPGTVIELSIENSFLPDGQAAAVLFTQVGG